MTLLTDILVPSGFATVATSGNYGDLNGKPSIPVSGTDFVPKNGGAFTGNVTLKGVTESPYNLVGTELNVNNGTIQYKTLAADETLTEVLTSGQGLTLMIDDGAAYSITWPTVTWVNNGGAAPTLATSGYTVISLWKQGTGLYAALVGDGS